MLSILFFIHIIFNIGHQHQKRVTVLSVPYKTAVNGKIKTAKDTLKTTNVMIKKILKAFLIQIIYYTIHIETLVFKYLPKSSKNIITLNNIHF